MEPDARRIGVFKYAFGDTPGERVGDIVGGRYIELARFGLGIERQRLVQRLNGCAGLFDFLLNGFCKWRRDHVAPVHDKELVIENATQTRQRSACRRLTEIDCLCGS